MKQTIRKLLLVSMLCAANAGAESRYVDVNSLNPIPPFTNWATAASVIQDAIDVALAGDEIVVTNGNYQTGGRVTPSFWGSASWTNRATIDKPVNLRSVNGPALTTIRGGVGVRCVYLSNGSTLTGFTLTEGSIPMLSGEANPDFVLHISGGGLLCESTNSLVSNCVVTANRAVYGGGAYGGTIINSLLGGNSAEGHGGGAAGARLIDSVITNNYAGWRGGGSYYGTLTRCVVVRNSAKSGGGTLSSQLADSILVNNQATNFGGGALFGTLTGCTLSNNAASTGGAVALATLANCTLTDNLASERAGAAFGGKLHNCLLRGNSAQFGGAASLATLDNCTIVQNSATSEGGGVFHPFWPGGNELEGCGGAGCEKCDPCAASPTILNNCIVYDNTAPVGANYGHYTLLNYSCTTPLPTNGIGNITNAPLFLDGAAGNFRLQSNSPCINAGLNAYMPPSLHDLDGSTRLVGDILYATVDTGAYEFQAPRSVISHAWLTQHGLAIDGSADFVDSDGDGVTNFFEWNSWTNPTNSSSALRLDSPVVSSNGVQLRWQSVPGQTYSLERGSSLGPPIFETIATNIIGQTEVSTFIDTNPTGISPLFYRIRATANFLFCPNARFGELCGFGN